MIGFIRGKIILKQPPALLLDVNGVGYEIEASMNTFYKLPELGEEVALYTHLTIRDDAHLLYGFHIDQERKLFRRLIKVNGVGPKLALAILSNMQPAEFARCLADNDTATLVRMPGVGKKTAERLVIEMRDKLDTWHTDSLSPDASGLPGVVGSAVQDAISALIALGYRPQEASKSVNRLASSDVSREELIRLALKEMG